VRFSGGGVSSNPKKKVFSYVKLNGVKISCFFICLLKYDQLYQHVMGM
jgi:hypothetical protein